MTSEKRRLRVFDSTLRDGEQAPGNAMSPEQKLEIALAIEALGVDTIEAGFPSSSPSDFKATQLISQALTTAKVATLNRATVADINAAAQSGGVENHQIQIMVTGSDVHLEHKRGMTRAEGLREVSNSFRHARAIGFTDLSLGVEDASRGSDELLRPLISLAIDEGAGTIIVADTTGCLLPAEFGDLIGRIRSWIPPSVILSTHCHHDLGLSLANALAGVEAGADEVQATLAGIGERAGNTPLEELAAVLTYKSDLLGLSTTLRTEGLYEAFLLLCETIGLQAPRNKAIFGTNAFATQAGIHQAGMLRNPITYEYAAPSAFGRKRSILIGRHSGRNVIRHMFDEIGAPVDDVLVDELYEEYVASRVGGDCVDRDVLRAILGRKLADRQVVGAGGDR
jgi:2-isopropylmalate synthase